MKIKYLILCFVASLLASCGEIDESNLKLYPSKLYLGVSGYNLQEIYDLGEESPKKEEKETPPSCGCCCG